MLAATPEPPYYACIFTSQQQEAPHHVQAYKEMAALMITLASQQEGFLGYESTRNLEGFGITVSYWNSLTAMQSWKAHTEHQIAQRLGREQWYQYYKTRICKVESDYEDPPLRASK